MSTGQRLPVADPAQVRAETRDLLSANRRDVLMMLLLHGGGALAGVISPLLIGRLVDQLHQGTASRAGVTQVIGGMALALLAQVVLAWRASRRSLLLGEKVFAKLRERFVDQVTRLPLSTVERAGGGDLISRTTNDVETISYSVRYAVPSVLVAVATAAIIGGTMVVTAPLVAAVWLTALPAVITSTVWYLRRARTAYLREVASYAALNGSVGETVDAARTVAAQRMQRHRSRRVDDDITEIYAAERNSLRLRMIWFPIQEFHYTLPVALTLGWGGWLVAHGNGGPGSVTPGEVAAVALLAMQLSYPLAEVLQWLDQLQLGSASLARIIGVGLVPPDRDAGARKPADEQIVATGLRYAYREGRDVLHDVDLVLRPGERLAVVGPSGAGKSTLGRLLAGIHPPGAGTVDVGGVPLVDLPVDELRSEVLLVTQEHHVFVGTVAENLRLAATEADDDQLASALVAVDAHGWVQALPEGMATMVGSGGHPLSPAQAQQIALARLVLAGPHTLVLDEATSLLDPRSARHLERSLSAVLSGRTVVAVAHRLHTAHDADRVAVVEDGRISELGTHAELVAAGGPYAALWRSWHGESVARK